MESGSLLANIAILVLAGFVGFAVISKVPNTLHTPLMSGTNAIHGIILVGAMLVTGHSDSVGVTIVGTIAIILAAANLVGGFVVTDRMLQMFSQKKKPKKPETQEDKKVEQKIEKQVEKMSGADSTTEMPAIEEEKA